MTLRHQVLPQIGKIVDLAIEDDAQLAPGIQHRLMPCRGEIDDGETTMSQTDASIRRPPFTSIIRPTVPHGVAAN
jgi:hypothetical protein